MTIMPTAGPVLCPVDFSSASGNALRWASAVARHRGAELTVLSVVEPLLAEAAETRLGVDPERIEESALREFVESTLPESERQAVRVRMEATVGDPSEAILETARRRTAGLIVMGTHGRGGFRKLLLGSTTEQVLRRTDWPVLVVPGGMRTAPSASDPGVRLRKILLATDFRESALAATDFATDLASTTGLPLVFAHVVEPIVVPAWEALTAELDDERVASGQRLLGRLSEGVRHGHGECVVSVGRPAETIASLAAEYGVGLVVMGLANAADSEQSRPGAIAYRVLRLAQVAVVVVPRGRAAADLEGAALSRAVTSQPVARS